MKVTNVTCWVLNWPFKYPLLEKTSNAVCNFVEIETDDGLKGHSMSGYGMPFALRDFINREVQPAIQGMDPSRTEDVRFKLLSKLSTKNFVGAWSNAASLIDIALWDIKGKATGQPVWKLLGGARDTVPAYITFGLSQYNREQLIEAAKTLIAAGHTKLKMVVGSSARPTDAGITEDAVRVHALRDAVGDEVELMMDANKNTTFNQALRLAKLVEPCNLTWFEDPVLKGDPLLMAQLRRQTTVPLAAGSTGTSDLMYFREYLVQGAVDYAQPNVRDIGGYTQGLKAAAIADAFNIQIQMGGNWPHINMHLHAGVPNGGRVEFHWQGWHTVQELFDGAPPPADGYVQLPDGPGLGFTPKEGIVKEFAVDE